MSTTRAIFTGEPPFWRNKLSVYHADRKRQQKRAKNWSLERALEIKQTER